MSRFLHVFTATAAALARATNSDVFSSCSLPAANGHPPLGPLPYALPPQRAFGNLKLCTSFPASGPHLATRNLRKKARSPSRGGQDGWLWPVSSPVSCRRSTPLPRAVPRGGPRRPFPWGAGWGLSSLTESTWGSESSSRIKMRCPQSQGRGADSLNDDDLCKASLRIPERGGPEQLWRSLFCSLTTILMPGHRESICP